MWMCMHTLFEKGGKCREKWKDEKDPLKKSPSTPDIGDPRTFPAGMRDVGISDPNPRRFGEAILGPRCTAAVHQI